MRFDILTIFPEMFTGPLTESIIKRAVQAGTLDIRLHNIRDYAADKHHTTDDTPYGGGAGMLMKAEPLAAAIRAVLDQEPRSENREPIIANQDSIVHRPSSIVLLLSPAGEPFTQRMAEELATYERLVLVCGRYEGVDERVREALIDREVSIGDYVLTGGELGAMVVLDAVARLVPGVIDALSIAEETFGDGLLEYPQFTRPAEWESRAVPPVLLSGHHGEVARWRRQQRLLRTLERRPDLLAQATLSAADAAFLSAHGWDGGGRQDGKMTR